jgi:hypothetical protein
LHAKEHRVSLMVEKNLEEFMASEPKPYLSGRELACVTPWTEQAIRTMITRGILREGEHYFYVGRKRIFKWASIVLFIEGCEEYGETRIPLRRGGFVGGAQKP